MPLRNAICIHEEDDGLLWKHYDWTTDDDRGAPLEPLRRLVDRDRRQLRVRRLLALLPGRRDRVRAEAHRDHHTAGCRGGERPLATGRSSPPALGGYHRHFFYARLDLDVDGVGEHGRGWSHASPLRARGTRTGAPSRETPLTGARGAARSSAAPRALLEGRQPRGATGSAQPGRLPARGEANVLPLQPTPTPSLRRPRS